MIEDPEWLPPLLRLSDFEGSWDKYNDELYSLFQRDLFSSEISFLGKPVLLDDRIIYKEKEEGFWHLTTKENGNVNERETDLRRCERLPWVKAVIENYSDKAVAAWRNRRGRKNNIVLFLEELNYVVILAETYKTFRIVTAYYVNYPSVKKKLIGEKQQMQAI